MSPLLAPRRSGLSGATRGNRKGGALRTRDDGERLSVPLTNDPPHRRSPCVPLAPQIAANRGPTPLSEVQHQQAAAPRSPRSARPYRAGAVRPKSPDAPRRPDRRAHRGLLAPLGHRGSLLRAAHSCASHSRAAGTRSVCAADRDERRGALPSSLATCAARRVAASRRAAPLAKTEGAPVRGRLNGTRRRRAATTACMEPTLRRARGRTAASTSAPTHTRHAAVSAHQRTAAHRCAHREDAGARRAAGGRVSWGRACLPSEGQRVFIMYI